MGKLHTVLCTVLILAAAFRSAVAFDYYTFALQWPAGRCSVRDVPCSVPLIFYFTVHGLWPSLYGGGSVTQCGYKDPIALANELGPPLTGVYLPASMPQILDFQNRSGDPDQNFWADQWNEHGSCSELAPVDYFLEILRLTRDIDLLQELESQNIVPGGTYLVGDFVAALPNRTALIECQIDLNGRYFLLEIRVCYDAGREAMPCPTPDYDSCGGPMSPVDFTGM
ncbi:unnamed protein product [Linum trigynum]|uniref:Uncharacterized protein n=1 Tax=Linum trigynum TaxID=586398 RepID=A0AAV2D1A7_9ROSI